MSLKSKIDWVLTGFSLALLKQGLRKRIQGAAADFLQPVTANTAAIFNRVDFIMETCAGKKVLHAGFTDHPFTQQRIADQSLLHLQLQKITTGLWGVDAESEAITLYKDITNDQYVSFADITRSYPEQAMQFAPDIILLGEVLEHLQQPHAAADLLYSSFTEGTKILVTVPNYMALDNMAAALHKTESVHPHHYWYFSPYTLSRVFAKEKFTLEQLHFGMYYQPGKRMNAVLRKYPFCGDCIMAVFSINKKPVR